MIVVVTDVGSVTRLVRKRASAAETLHDPTGSGSLTPDTLAVRREIDVLSRCDAAGIVQLVGFGEHPVTWLETIDAGAHTLASPPLAVADRLAALAALARVLAGLHRRGWVHLSLEPEHAIWRRRATTGPSTSRSGGDIDVTLCSLGSAVCPAGPAERAADREALATIMASTLLTPGGATFALELRSALAAVAVDLRSGDLDDLDALATGLDDLVEAAQRSTDVGASEHRTPGSDSSVRRRLGELTRRLSPRSPVRLGLAAALGLTVLGGAGILVARAGPGTPPGRSTGSAASARCSQPAVPPPRVDPDGSGCGRSAGYHSSVLTVGTARWSLGDDIADGRLVDLDGDGWSELAALRNDGEVFLVRHFPVNASDAVRVRSVATAPGATRLFATSSGVGLDGLRASDADGAPTPLLPSATGPGAGSESDPGSPATVKAAPTTGGGP